MKENLVSLKCEVLLEISISLHCKELFLLNNIEKLPTYSGLMHKVFGMIEDNTSFMRVYLSKRKFIVIDQYAEIYNLGIASLINLNVIYIFVRGFIYASIN